jgi:hypothetical protein
VFSVDTSEQRLCTACIGNKTFARWIRVNGSTGKCDFSDAHGRRRKSVTVEMFAQHVDEWFRDNYQRGSERPVWEGDSDSPSYETSGDPYKWILADELSCDEPVIEAISENLPDATNRDISQGDEAFYDDCQNYESVASVNQRSQQEEEDYWFEHRVTFEWHDFCQAVQFKNRFFKVKKRLDDLFGKPEEYSSGAHKPIYLLKAGQHIYRARIFDDGFSETDLNEDAARHLGAPPANKATAGRMNVEYIPAFYAAFSEDTAIAEIRPSIGDSIAVGTFALQRDINVFDFSAFSRANRSKNSEIYSHTRYDFLSKMEDEISKPILPYEKQREYIPTQIVAEYLREYFKCDAVIYRSSMHNDDGVDNRNIVIMNYNDGTEFGGNVTTLSLIKRKIKEVNNVTFSTRDRPF